MEDNHLIRDIELIDEIHKVEDTVNLLLMGRLKFYKYRENPLENLDELSFRTKYWLSKRTALFVIDLVKENLEHDLRGGAVPPYLQVLTAIQTWARGEVKIILIQTT